MRYPVGFRATWADACLAAEEAGRLTGIKYRVRRVADAAPEVGVYDAWEFRPVEIPDPSVHVPTRV